MVESRAGACPILLRTLTSHKTMTVMEEFVLVVEITPLGKHWEFSCVSGEKK